MLDNTLCSKCQIAPEDSFHALWSCKALHLVWLSNFSWPQGQYPQLRSVFDLMSVVLKESARLDVFAMVAWSVWFRRNKLRCNEQSLPIHEVFESASTLLSKFQQKLPIHGPKPKLALARWKPPAPGEMKANFVGAVFVDSGEAGVGVVI